MEQKRVSFAVAKAIKEAGYNEPCDMYYHIYDDEYDSEMSLEMTGNGCKDFVNNLNRYRCAAPTYMEVWLWLDEQNLANISVSKLTDGTWEAECCANEHGWVGAFSDHKTAEDSIVAAIEYLIKNDLIK